MNQNDVAKWLKGICISVAIMGVIFFGVIVPRLAMEFKTENPEVGFLYWPCLISVWIIGVLCYAILYQFWKVCVQIGKDNSFSCENSKSFVTISKLAAVIAVICFAGMFYLGVNNWMNPGIMLLMIGVIFMGITIAVLAAALSHLILKAYEMKQENELTI